MAEFSPLNRSSGKKRELCLDQSKSSESLPKPLGKLPLMQGLEPPKKVAPPSDDDYESDNEEP